MINVIDKGAVPDGVSSCLDAFNNAYNAAQAGETIYIPASASSYFGVNGLVSGSKFVIWDAEGQPSGGGLWKLPGLVNQGYVNRIIYGANQTSPDSYGNIEFQKNANHVGGTLGNVSGNVRVLTNVGPSASDSQWGIISVLKNGALHGNNVAIYGQATKTNGSACPTWAAVFEARNPNNTAENGGALFGVEVDVSANGADTHKNRLGIDVIAYKLDKAGEDCQVTYGVRLNATAGASFTTGFGVIAPCVVGFTTENANITSSAYRMARGQAIAFEPTSAYKMYCDVNYSVIRIDNAGVEKVGFDISNSPGLKVNGTKVISQRDTGWALMTGTQNKSAVFNTATATKEQLAQRLAAIEAALWRHGLIGI